MKVPSSTIFELHVVKQIIIISERIDILFLGHHGSKTTTCPFSTCSRIASFNCDQPLCKRSLSNATLSSNVNANLLVALDLRYFVRSFVGIQFGSCLERISQALFQEGTWSDPGGSSSFLGCSGVSGTECRCFFGADVDVRFEINFRWTIGGR